MRVNGTEIVGTIVIAVMIACLCEGVCRMYLG
jgi:hypothetical protein